MAKANNKTEDQHYVPKMLLRRFAVDPKEKEQVHVFDKHEDKKFLTHIRNIAAERGFYETDVSDGRIEKAFSELEDNTSPVIAKIVVDQTLGNLDAGELGWLAAFIATQHLRTKQLREVIRHLNDGHAEHIRAMGHEPKDVEGFQPIESEDDLTAMALIQLATMIKESSGLIGEKVAFLSKTTPDNPFWISDHPVVMHNSNDFGAYGNIGLAVPGIEIYLPLSSTMLLGLWCPSVAEPLAQNLDRAQEMRNELSKQLLAGSIVNPGELKKAYDECTDVIEHTKPIVEALQNGSTIEATADNVTFYNALQVRWSHRFVMSSQNDFALVERMIRDNPKFREGVKPTFG